MRPKSATYIELQCPMRGCATRLAAVDAADPISRSECHWSQWTVDTEIAPQNPRFRVRVGKKCRVATCWYIELGEDYIKYNSHIFSGGYLRVRVAGMKGEFTYFAC